MVSCDENIGALQIPVQNFLVVQGFQALGHVHQGFPDLLLAEASPALGVRLDLLEHVSLGGKLHDDAECCGHLVVECLLVADYVFAIV